MTFSRDIGDTMLILSDTSKHGPDNDQLGSHGTFLASVSALSIMTIISCQRSHGTANGMILHHSRLASRMTPAPTHMQPMNQDHGTRVVVHDLFGNMPVRVRQRPADESGFRAREKEWAFTCQVVTGMILALGRPIFLNMKASDKEHVYRVKTLPNAPHNQPYKSIHLEAASFDAHLIRSTLIQGANIDPNSWSSWIRTSARTPFLTIRAVICLEPAPSKQLQYLALGTRYISPLHGFNVLYDTVNHVFDNSSFAVREEEPGKRAKDVWLTNRQLKGAGRGVDRWPMFFIRIDLSDRSSHQLKGPEEVLDSASRLSAITEILRTMAVGFLREHNFGPRRQRSTRELSPRKPANPAKRLTSLDKSHSTEADSRQQKHEVRSQSTRRQKKSANRASFFDDLSAIVRFPMTEKDDLPYEPRENNFKSRIKISSSNDIEALLASAGPRGLRKPYTVSLPTRVATPIAGSPAPPQSPKNTLDRNSDEASNPISTNGNGSDDTIRWIHPVTQELLLLNARTGCVVNPALASRPLSVDDGAMQACTSRGQGSARKRLVRTSSGFAQPQEGSWVSTFFENWENPVFQKSEESIPKVNLDALESGLQHSRPGSVPTGGNGNSGPTLPLQARLAKSSLRNATIISQVDSKFILIKAAGVAQGGSSEQSERNLLVLIDQHAADERVKVEMLLDELCTPASENTRFITSPLGHRSKIETTSLQKPMIFELHDRENAIFRRSAARFAQWGVLFDLVLTHTGPSTIESQSICRLVVLTLPPGIAERCRIEPKLLIEMLRSEAWRMEESKARDPGIDRDQTTSSQEHANGLPNWLQRVASCPQGILDLLNSRSCRSAIMFNDELSLQQCEALVGKLAECRFPFQCAHGRPTMVPLVDVGGLRALGEGEGGLGRSGQDEVDFGTAWKRWVEDSRGEH